MLENLGDHRQLEGFQRTSSRDSIAEIPEENQSDEQNVTQQCH
jgi:hypothetical protein